MAIKDLVELFFDDNSIINKKTKEDIKLYEHEVVSSNLRVPDEAELREIMGVLPSRDEIYLDIAIEDFETYSITLKDFGELEEIAHTMSISPEAENFKLKVTINKSIVRNILSIYSSEIFFQSLFNLNFKLIMHDFNEILENRNYLILAPQYATEDIFFTESLFYNTDNEGISREDRELLLTKKNDVSNFLTDSKLNLTPQDFYLTKRSNNEGINEFFEKVTGFLTLIFLSDISSVEKDDILEFKINGYRQINDKLVFKEFNKNIKELYQTYEWVYNEGNLSDKIGLARNIISINYDKNESGLLTSNTFNSIRSGYSIYLKENVQQYIDVTNRLSEYLIDLSMKANDVIKTFGSSFRNNNFIVASFFLSVIVFNSLSARQFSEMFTNDVLAIAMVILFVSTGYLISSIYLTNEQVKKFDNDFEKIKSIYGDLLSPGDLEKLFDEKYLKTNKDFVTKKITAYSIVWALEIIAFFIMLLVVNGFFSLNNSSGIVWLKTINNFLQFL